MAVFAVSACVRWKSVLIVIYGKSNAKLQQWWPAMFARGDTRGGRAGRRYPAPRSVRAAHTLPSALLGSTLHTERVQSGYR